jgi:hypothetical protein
MKRAIFLEKNKKLKCQIQVVTLKITLYRIVWKKIKIKKIKI